MDINIIYEDELFLVKYCFTFTFLSKFVGQNKSWENEMFYVYIIIVIKYPSSITKNEFSTSKDALILKLLRITLQQWGGWYSIVVGVDAPVLQVLGLKYFGRGRSFFRSHLGHGQNEISLHSILGRDRLR